MTCTYFVDRQWPIRMGWGDHLVKTSSVRHLVCQNGYTGTGGQSPVREINEHNLQQEQGLSSCKTRSATGCNVNYCFVSEQYALCVRLWPHPQGHEFISCTFHQSDRKDTTMRTTPELHWTENESNRLVLCSNDSFARQYTQSAPGEK